MKSITNILPRCSFLLFWGLMSSLYAIVFEGIEFASSPVCGIRGLAILTIQWMVVSMSAAMVIGLISISRLTFAVLFPVLTVLSAIAAYFKLTLGTSITAGVIELAVVNEFMTWASLVTWQLIVVAAGGFVAGVSVAVYRWFFVERPRLSVLWAIVFVIGIITPVKIIHRFRSPVVARMPYSFWFSIEDYLDNRREILTVRNTFDNISAECDIDSMTVIVVLGESLRADHLSLNGYKRSTTPRLEAEKTLVSVPGMWTDACYTHVSVPHIMTRADSTDYERAFTEQSFIPLFKKAGYSTAWFSNQDAVSSYVCFMHEADTLVQVNAARSLYDFGKWLDSDMLAPAVDFISGPNTKKLGVIHAIGSHWWYRSHYPDSLALYKPEINSRVVSELTQESIINSYDNTILATDAFLSDVVDNLRNRCAVLIFISDHGESLGEGGRFLHASGGDELHHTACFVWYSSSFASSFPQKIKALRMNSLLPQRTDAIFHTVLDAGGISTPVLNQSLSLFHQ